MPAALVRQITLTLTLNLNLPGKCISVISRSKSVDVDVDVEAHVDVGGHVDGLIRWLVGSLVKLGWLEACMQVVTSRFPGSIYTWQWRLFEWLWVG